MKKLTKKIVKDVLENCGYYLSCAGCDYENTHLIKGTKCSKDEMISGLTKELKNILNEKTG